MTLLFSPLCCSSCPRDYRDQTILGFYFVTDNWKNLAIILHRDAAQQGVGAPTEDKSKETLF
jgi:hypothetical protein